MGKMIVKSNGVRKFVRFNEKNLSKYGLQPNELSMVIQGGKVYPFGDLDVKSKDK